MKTRIQKWGNSLAIRIPKAFAQELSFQDETMVELTIDAEQLVIAPVDEKTLRLQDLIAMITPENRHEEIITDLPRGREVI
ncbi:MAG: AbrB/MazE/SpoVT family DNA-binding domain-containing protein [Ignavibacteriae bacterium]|nr:MAG: AbrB/MazE/SpoVT family DNA-binding domain-containing protein [Ignavibacteriota bacterium]